MKCPYDETIECGRISYENWVTGKLSCDKCRTGILARQFGIKKVETP